MLSVNFGCVCLALSFIAFVDQVRRCRNIVATVKMLLYVGLKKCDIVMLLAIVGYFCTTIYGIKFLCIHVYLLVFCNIFVSKLSLLLSRPLFRAVFLIFLLVGDRIVTSLDVLGRWTGISKINDRSM